MAAYSPGAIRQVIREVMDGTLQGAAAVPAGVFASGVFDGQPLGAQKTAAFQTETARNRFDVRLRGKRTHGASAMGAFTNTAIELQELEILITTNVQTSVELDARDDALQQIANDCALAVGVLRYPYTLLVTSDSVVTGIVDGMLIGSGGTGWPQWEPVSEDWNQQLVKSRIVASCVLDVSPVSGPLDNILVDDDGVTPILDDSGQFILVS